MAWIETLCAFQQTGAQLVATREGGVDRNHLTVTDTENPDRSPPARVAWIETGAGMVAALVAFSVATREGGVDRN